MSRYAPRELTGQLHRNARKTAEAQPDHTGSVTVAGTTYRVAAWIKEGAAGRFFSLRLEPIPPALETASTPPGWQVGDDHALEGQAPLGLRYQHKARLPGEYPEPKARKPGPRRRFGDDSIPF